MSPLRALAVFPFVLSAAGVGEAQQQLPGRSAFPGGAVRDGERPQLVAGHWLGGLQSVSLPSGRARQLSGFGLGGFGSVDGSTFDPATGTLYFADRETCALVALDTASGEVAFRGLIGFPLLALAYDANAGVLYGTDQPGRLVRIDPATGEGTPVGVVGAEVRSLAFDPNTGTLYGSEYAPGILISIDTSTAARTQIGVMSHDYVASMAFDPVTGTLYGYAGQSNNDLVTIDTATAASTSRGSTAYSSGLAFDPVSGTLYSSWLGEVRDVDPANGNETRMPWALGYGSASAIAHDPATGTTYGVDGNLELLFSVDLDTGWPTVIGPTGGYRIGGLAFDLDTGVLYAGAYTGEVLSLDTTTGAPALIGASGVAFEGLTFDQDHDVLYGVTRSFSGDELVTVDTATGAAGVVGPLGYSLVTHGVAWEAATGKLYAYTSSHLAEVDPETGNATPIAPIGNGVRGLCFDDATGTLYSLDTLTTGQLVTVDPVTGRRETMIGSFDFRSVEGLAYDPARELVFGVSEADKRLVAYDPASGHGLFVAPLEPPTTARSLTLDPAADTLYAVDVAADALVAIDPDTGAVTSIGPLGTPDVAALCFDPVAGVLYAVNAFGELSTVDPATGASTPIGPTNFAVTGLAFDPLTGVLYGGDSARSALLVIDRATGAGTIAGRLCDVRALAGPTR